MQINGLHEYEEWLDTLDKRLFVMGEAIRVEFDHPIDIQLQDCKDVIGLKLQASRLRSALHQNNSHLPRKYLIQRFVGLALKHNRIHLECSQVMNELKSDWGIEDELHDY